MWGSCGQRIGGAISCSNFAYVPTRLTTEVGCPPGYSLDRSMHSNRSRQAGKQASSGCSASGKAQTFRNHEGFPNVCDVSPIAIGWGDVSVMWCRCICVHFREKETAGRSTPARPVLKLRKTRISRIKQLRRAIRLWFVCVFLGRQGPPRPARQRISEK